MGEKERIHNYMMQIAKIINELLNSSDDLRSLIKKMEMEGYKVNIGFVSMVSGKGESEQLRFELTPEDKEFLKNIGIAYDEDNDDNNDD